MIKINKKLYAKLAITLLVAANIWSYIPTAEKSEDIKKNEPVFDTKITLVLREHYDTSEKKIRSDLFYAKKPPPPKGQKKPKKTPRVQAAANSPKPEALDRIELIGIASKKNSKAVFLSFEGISYYATEGDVFYRDFQIINILDNSLTIRNKQTGTTKSFRLSSDDNE